MPVTSTTTAAQPAAWPGSSPVLTWCAQPAASLEDHEATEPGLLGCPEGQVRGRPWQGWPPQLGP